MTIISKAIARVNSRGGMLLVGGPSLLLLDATKRYQS